MDLMISIIFTISNEAGFNNLKRSIINLEGDYGLGLDILCVVENKDLYIPCRDYLLDNVDEAGVLTTFKECLITESNRYVYLAGQDFIIPFKGITKLYQDYIEIPTAGFIGGKVEGHSNFWVEDIYKDIRWQEKELQGGLVEVDVAPLDSLMTESQNFLNVFDNTDWWAYGLSLRKQGYKNYLDTRVEVKYGEKQ